jgi:N-acetylmuramic acid 6-phosphate etherase
MSARDFVEPVDSSVSTLDTEAVNAATTAIDRMSPLEIVQAMNMEDARVAQAVAQELPAIAQAIEAIAARMRQGGRLIYIGAGTSGRLGVLDASECPPTFNVSPEQVIGIVAGGPMAMTYSNEDAEDSAEAGRADVAKLSLSAQDVLTAIAASGRTPYVLGAVAYAHEQGALTIGIACNANTPLSQVVDCMIAPVVGPEVITGSTRLKAGTAQKMVLNMLSTGTMVLLGKTFGNLMVDVQTTNYKLYRRAVKIVQLATGVDSEAADVLLQASDGEVKTAIVVGRAQVTPAAAREQLVAHNDALRSTLEALQNG